MVVDSGKLALTGAAAETPPCSEAIKYDDVICSLYEGNGESSSGNAL
jgi:hypothetical protein